MSFIGTRLEGRNVGHFIFDLWFYIDDGNAPQALEFDVNRAFGGTRWTWGSECDFNTQATRSRSQKKQASRA
jgi:hypothetical protein